MFCTYDWLPSLDINDVTPVQNLDPFLNMVSTSIKQLTILSAGMVIQQWHIYTKNLMIIPWIVLELSRKMCLFHLNMNIEGRFCRHFVTSSDTSSAWEISFMPNLHMVFPFLMSNWGYIEQANIFKRWRNFEIWANFFSSKVSSEGSYINRIANTTPAFWAFDRRSGSKIDGFMAIWKFGLFFYLVT